MWIYFVTSHGPGHQSTTDGFIPMPDRSKDEDIEYKVERRCSDCYNPVIRYWKVSAPSPEHVAREIRILTDTIRSAKAGLVELKKMDATVIQEKGRDEQLMEALVGVINHSLLALLHNRKIMVTEDDISMWFYGRRKPVKAIRRRVMNAIKAADKYLSYSKKKG